MGLEGGGGDEESDWYVCVFVQENTRKLSESVSPSNPFHHHPQAFTAPSPGCRVMTRRRTGALCRCLSSVRLDIALSSQVRSNISRDGGSILPDETVSNTDQLLVVVY
jgi:hypothetical protein